MPAPVRDRIAGAMLGLAVGDALGAPVEFRRRGTFPLVTDMDTVRSPRLPPGAWTDDTAMALCLADSLLAHEDLDPRDLLDRFCRWRDAGEHTSMGVCVGIGQGTLRALNDYSRSGITCAVARPRSDGNGALMRVAPVACRHWSSTTKAIDLARRQSWTTHGSPLSADCCARAVELMCGLLQGDSWVGASARSSSLSTATSTATSTAACPPAGWWPGLTREQVVAGGFVADTLHAAFWAVDSTDTFEGAVVAAVNLGDDADTVGAVAGQIAGCRYGRAGIPARWLSALVGVERIEAVARRLADEATKGLA